MRVNNNEWSREISKRQWGAGSCTACFMMCCWEAKEQGKVCPPMRSEGALGSHQQVLPRAEDVTCSGRKKDELNQYLYPSILTPNGQHVKADITPVPNPKNSSLKKLKRMFGESLCSQHGCWHSRINLCSAIWGICSLTASSLSAYWNRDLLISSVCLPPHHLFIWVGDPARI